MSEPMRVNSGHDMKCGHQEPDIDKLSWKSFYPTDQDRFIILDLQKPNLVKVVQDSKNFLHTPNYHPFILT